MATSITAENPARPRRSTPLRFFRWLFSWKTLRRLLLAFVSLFTLVALLLTEENWRGRRAWENFKREWEAKGERFDLASFIPKSVPGDQNFVTTSFFAPLLQREHDLAEGGTNPPDFKVPQSTLDVYGDTKGKRAPSFGNLMTGKLTDLQEWQRFYRANTNFPSVSQSQGAAKDVLLALDKFRPVLTELREASRRPLAVFPLYPDKHHDFGVLPLIHLSNLKTIPPVLRLRASALLSDGRSHEALEDVEVSFRLADALKPEPFLISHLVRLSILDTSINSVWEGLARHQWSDPELVELQNLIQSIDLLLDYDQVIRGERAGANAMIAKMLSGRQLMTGLLYQNQLRINRLYQLRFLPLINSRLHRVYPNLSNQLTNAPEIRKRTPYNVLARMLLPAIEKNALKAAHEQTILDQAALACALERYRLANGLYPENLQSLVPQLIKRIPTDVINGESLHYHRTDYGRFVLYSIGWNEKDDGGTVAWTDSKPPSVNPDKGDWVWEYPVN